MPATTAFSYGQRGECPRFAGAGSAQTYLNCYKLFQIIDFTDMVAGHKMSGADLLGCRCAGKAGIVRIGAPLGKPALVAWIDRGCDLTLNQTAFLFTVGIGTASRRALV